jgi:hypothetical protein
MGLTSEMRKYLSSEDRKQMSDVFEFGSWSVECGIKKGQASAFFHLSFNPLPALDFRIPHSNFRILEGLYVGYPGSFIRFIACSINN